ncbi:MAG TPA: ABC transporter permease, partial [Acidobacteriota bacterium]|nr:ABC transporter permease [Acidobacteriota bacterium]
MLERIRHMLIKEFIQVLRDPRMRGVIFLAPIFQLLVLSYAITTDIRNISLAVFDQDRTVASRQLVQRFSGSGYFVVERQLVSENEIRDMLDGSDVQIVLRIGQGYGGDIGAGRPATVQVILDGTDSNTASVILQYAGRLIADHSRQIQLEAFRRQAGSVLPAGHIDLRPRAWFNPNLESRIYYVPGFIAIIVTLVTLMLTSMAVVREKEIGTMEQLLVSPITPWEFILGKSVPFAIIAFADVILATTVGVLWFDVPVRGSL